jgi:hypothetical protein
MLAGPMPPSDDTVAIPFLAFVLIFMPVAGVISWYRLRTREPRGTKKQRYAGTLVIQLWLLASSVGVAAHENINLFPAFPLSLLEWSVSALFLFAVFRKLRFKWNQFDAARKKRLARLLPETPEEMKWGPGFRYWLEQPKSALTAAWPTPCSS